MRKTILILPILLIFGILVLVFNNNERSDPARLNVALSWKVNANSIGPIAALEKGFYSDEKLTVEIIPGGLGNTMISGVAIGEYQIGISNAADTIISARSNGTPLVIIAASHDQNYHGFFSRQESNIVTPQDWIGKKVGVKAGSATFLMYQLLLEESGISRDQVIEIPVKYDLAPFLSDQVDVFPGAITNEGIVFEQAGIELNTIRPSEYGIQSYSGVIVTSERFRSAHPDILEKFVAATMKGWLWALEDGNENEAAIMLSKYDKSIKIEKETLAIIRNRDWLNPDPNGKINIDRLNELALSMQKLGVISEVPQGSDMYTPLRQ